jgi:hypothetical protein
MSIERNSPKISFIALLTVVALSLSIAISYGRVAETSAGGSKSNFQEPQKIVGIYLKAVSEGELIVFDKVLDESILIPHSVEYVYELGSPDPRIKVFSKLKQMVPVSGQQGIKVQAVNSTLDGDGHIVETEAHIIVE